MNITFVNNSIGYGGAAKMMMVVAHGLQAKGHNVSIINLNTNNVGVGQDVEGVPVITANIGLKAGVSGNFSYVKFTIKAAKQLRSDVLIGFKELANFCVSIAGRFLHIPSIISERGDPFISFGNLSFQHRLKLFCINNATGAVFQTQGAAEFYSKHLQKNCAIIPNPILIDKDIPAVNYNDRPKTVVSLGRISNKQKRLDVMVEAFALFHETHPDYTLIIYGSGEDTGKLFKFISDNHIEESVKLMGATNNSLAALSKEGIFIITSDYEGISNSLLEAMAVGLPVVSTDHSPGGARLLITDHENGLLAPMRDAKALSSALSEYADNPELAKKCGNNAKQVLNRFTVEKAVDDWERFINRLTNR